MNSSFPERDVNDTQESDPEAARAECRAEFSYHLQPVSDRLRLTDE